MRRALVTGGDGQLGADVACVLASEFQVVSTDLPDFNITNLDSTIQSVRHIQPEVIVHCAALTDVDGCEDKPDLAYLVNGGGARNLAIAAHKIHARLVHISTNYIFDGSKDGPYREHDCPNPQTVYGLSKWMGEKFVTQQTHAHFVLRIAWLYGRMGNNFVKTMLRLAHTEDELQVVNDQFSTPTWTADVARQIMRLLETEAYGTYHSTSQGSCSRFEFATAVLMEAGVDVPIVPMNSAKFPRSAPRPKNSVLDNHLLRIQKVDIMPPWRESLTQFMSDRPFESQEESR